MNVRRPLTVVAGVVASIALAAGPASAHLCYHKNLNAKAAVGVAGSNGFISFGDIVEFELEGLCSEGVDMLATAGGVTPDTLINAHGVMAGGLGMQGRHNKSIGHVDFDGVFAAIPDAYAACGMEMPPEI
jgi:hypothetical protein